MNQQLLFFQYLKSAAILIVVSLYFVAPLHQPLAEGFHKIAHAFSNTSSAHSHQDTHTSNHHHHNTHQHQSHTHKLVSIFNSLFSSDVDDNQQAPKTIELDKHVVQLTVFIPKFHKPKKQQQFNYSYSDYFTSFSITVPPPKGIIS